VTFTGTLTFSELEFGALTQIDFGNGIVGQATLQLNNDGTFNNSKVIITIGF